MTDKQREAMELAHANYVFLSIHDIIKSIAVRLLQGFKED